MKLLLGSYDTPLPGAPLADHDAHLLWLKGKREEGYAVDRQIASAERNRAFTVWMRDPNRIEGEDFDAYMARTKAA